MITLSSKGPLYFELYEALSYFISRQQLVARAVTDQGVDLVDMKRGVGGWYDKTPQVGQWGDWDFYFHGGGCRLTHRHTKEPIDWNGPDPSKFDPHFFLRHLEWRLDIEAGLPYLARLVAESGSKSVIDLIKELIADGIITPDRHLTPQMDASQANAA